MEPEKRTRVAAGETHGMLAQANPSTREVTDFRVLFHICDAHPPGGTDPPECSNLMML
jgi:hypothetical protein